MRESGIKKIAVILLGIPILLIGMVWIALLSVDFNEHKKDIQSFFHQQYGLQVSVYGSVRPSLFPLPHITINSVHISDGVDEFLYADELSIYVGLMDLFDLKKLSKVEEVEVNGAGISLDSILAKLQEVSVKRSEIPKISLKKAALSIGEHCSSCILLSNFTMDIREENNSLELSADLKNNDVSYSLSFAVGSANSKDESRSIAIVLQNDFFKWSTEGKIERLFGELDEVSAEGKSTLTVNNFRNFILDLYNTSFNSYAGKKLLQTSALKEFNFSATSDISLEDGLLKFNNLSTSLGDSFDVNPGLIVDFLEKEVLFRAAAKRVNLDDLIYLNGIQSLMGFFEFLSEYFQYESNLNLTKFFTLFFDIEVDEMVFSDSEKGGLVLSGDMVNGLISINQGRITFPGNSVVEISGSTSDNGIRPKFDASLMISIEDVATLNKLVSDYKNSLPNAAFLKTDISIIPHRIRLMRLRAALDESLVIGNLAILRDALDKRSITGAMRFSQVDLDKFGVDDLLDNFIFILFKSDSDKTGKTYFSLLDDYKWLRYLNFSLDMDLAAEKLFFKKKAMNNAVLSFSIVPGNISANDFSVYSELIDLDGNFSLSLPGFKPKIKSELNFKFLDTEVADYLFPSFDSLQEKISPGNVITDADRDKINLYSINNFDGELLFKADKIKHGERTVENAKLDLNVANGIVIIKNLEADIFSGNLKMIGNISALETVFPITIGFALNNVDPNQLLDEFAGIKKLNGYMSLSGSASTSGINWNTAKQRLQAKIMVAGRNLTWDGFDLDKIINSTEADFSRNDRLKYLDYYTKYGRSFFTQLNGQIEIRNAVADFKDFRLLSGRASGALVARCNIFNNLASAAARFSFIPVGYTTPLSLQIQSVGEVKNLKTTFDLKQITDFIDRISVSQTTDTKQDNEKPSSLRDISSASYPN